MLGHSFQLMNTGLDNKQLHSVRNYSNRMHAAYHKGSTLSSAIKPVYFHWIRYGFNGTIYRQLHFIDSFPNLYNDHTERLFANAIMLATKEYLTNLRSVLFIGAIPLIKIFYIRPILTKWSNECVYWIASNRIGSTKVLMVLQVYISAILVFNVLN